MEFFYTGHDGTEQGPYTERQMTDWLRQYNNFHEELKIRFQINGKTYNTTLARMRIKNGYCTPFIFAKCDRVDKEKEVRKEIETAAIAMQNIERMMEDVGKSIDTRSLLSRQLMERMQRMIDAASATADRVKRAETSPVPATPAAPAATSVSKAPPPPTNAAANEPSTSRTPKRILPLFDLSPFAMKDDLGDRYKEAVRIFRNALDDIDLDEAQKNLKFPIGVKCRGCDGRAISENTLGTWLCHITSKNHIDKFRVKGGRVTQPCLDWYSIQLKEFPKIREEKEEIVDLEKKKLEWYMGVIMLPVHIPLLHIDPSDTTRLSPSKGKQEMAKLRQLVFGPTDRISAEKSLYLPTTMCEVCKEKFAYTPRMVPHLLSNAHIEKYLAKRGSFSQHDFDFWTAICKLFPEAGKDSRDQKAVRAQLREMGRMLDISHCKNSLHYTIYGGEDRRKHVVDFIKKQLVEHQSPVVVYTQKEEEGKRMMEYVKEQLPETKVGWVNCTEECEGLEVMVTDSTLRLSRPHSLAFPFAPLLMSQKADYAQKMCGEHVEANLIIAFGQDEPVELRKFSRGAPVPFSAPYPPPPPPPTATTVPTAVPTVIPVAPTVVPQMQQPTRPTPPVASVTPFASVEVRPRSSRVGQGSNPYPTVPPNQRRYDPNQFDQSPKTPESPKSKCAMM